eukprot:CAMPEP_0113848598 /NCGR_PEP_ID=MMETSP0372-20130328/2582_1 /TAXON_ID=340204 /ORGANISM="Lankesteria abbotti" /LENGTH=192 /DNA_ID=CAMNT_0000818131 /DNA_START=48 /DNA_END=626 /DNA_ORIENTATION=+ /assembly_acc=CAM_ASM_000359
MGSFQDFGELVLLIGDFHIPQRAADMPKCFRELLETDKIKHVLCTGNIGSRSVLNHLHRVAPQVHVVRGESDLDFEFPDYKIVHIGEFRVGLLHGHQIMPWGQPEGLCEWQRRLDCDILVTGNTHKNNAEQIDGRFFINPGSATGAYHPQCPDATPSFMLMAVQGSNVMLYVYEEKNGKPVVVMSEFHKPKA